MFEVELGAEEKSKEMNGVLDRLTLIKRILESLSELVEEAEIKVSSDGMGIQVMDLMHVALADVFLPCSMFTKYRCDRELSIGVKLKVLVKVLRGMSVENNGMFRMECDDAATSLNIKNIREGNVLSFKLKLFSFDFETCNVPEFDFDVDVTIPTGEFMYIPKLVGAFGDFIGIEAEDRSVKFVQTGESADTSMTLRESAEKEGVKIDIKSPVSHEVAMKYINLISKVAPLCESVRMSLGAKQPVFFNFVVGDAAYIKFYIAPKVDVDQ